MTAKNRWRALSKEPFLKRSVACDDEEEEIGRNVSGLYKHKLHKPHLRTFRTPTRLQVHQFAVIAPVSRLIYVPYESDCSASPGVLTASVARRYRSRRYLA